MLRHQRSRLPLRGFALLILCAVAGCSSSVEGYPDELRYPVRTDPIVASVPNAVPKSPIAAGKLDEAILELKNIGGKLYLPDQLSENDRRAIEEALVAKFGTPARPLIDGHDPEGRLALGSQHFRRQCVQCHGLSGNGRGPTGLWISPTPRDFRQGAFKFVSSKGSAPRKPSRDDLLRTLQHGLPGTAMPAFAMLGDDVLKLIIDYVMHLSIRGEVEYKLMLTILSEGHDSLDGSIPEEVNAFAKRSLNEWMNIEPIIVPDDREVVGDDPESVRRGWQLFHAKEGAGCLACHENYGRSAQARYDIWGTQVVPRNLTEPVYKGGKQPKDHFLRVRGGIAPSGMPAVEHLSNEQVWDIVHFVQALPYPARLPIDVRAHVYPELTEGVK